MIKYTPPTPNHNPQTWMIWGILTAVMLFIIISAIIIFLIRNKKNNKVFLTVKKITVFSTFLTMFLIQALLLSPLLKLPIPFSFDSITTIAIGFIFGPLEGILFGWVADSLRVLINGWSYQLLPSLMYPMIGLISGLFGMLYWNKGEIDKWKSITIFQVAIISIFVLTIPLEYLMFTSADANSTTTFYATLTTTLLTLIFMEGLFTYILIKEIEKKELFLLMLIVCVAYADRMMELAIRPFTQYFTGFESSYVIALFTRMVSSTYLIPTVSFTSFILIKTTLYVLELK